MRPAHDAPARPQSPTPIYDSLYAEYRRAFRALPGDRTGEENLGFSPFFGHGEQRGSWERSRSWERPRVPDPTGRQHRRNAPAALPPGSHDNRGHDR